MDRIDLCAVCEWRKTMTPELVMLAMLLLCGNILLRLIWRSHVRRIRSMSLIWLEADSGFGYLAPTFRVAMRVSRGDRVAVWRDELAASL